MKRVFILLEEQWQSESLPEAEAAVRTYREYGFDAELRVFGARERIERVRERMCEARAAFGTLCIADSWRLLGQLADCGAAFCAYSHSGNAGEDLSAAEYILMEPQWVDRDSLVKIWQRQRNLPWTILQTERCIVREFVPEDLDAIYELYDEEARRFLEAPSGNRSLEKEILTAYIRRVYRLGGYGDWAVIEKTSGRLIGRMGYSFPSAETPEPAPDVTFGYLIHSGWRGRGIAKEAGKAILEYGFTQLGFETIGADAAVSNTVSDKLLRSFGFVPASDSVPSDRIENNRIENNRIENNRIEDRRYYVLTREVLS